MRMEKLVSSQQVLTALKTKADAERAKNFPRFFKTGPGEYGEGDYFLGVTVPNQRVIAKLSASFILGNGPPIAADQNSLCAVPMRF